MPIGLQCLYLAMVGIISRASHECATKKRGAVSSTTKPLRESMIGINVTC